MTSDLESHTRGFQVNIALQTKIFSAVHKEEVKIYISNHSLQLEMINKNEVMASSITASYFNLGFKFSIENRNT